MVPGYDAHVLAIAALASIALALLARYRGRVLGLWRFAYAAGALFALYINVFAALVRNTIDRGRDLHWSRNSL